MKKIILFSLVLFTFSGCAWFKTAEDKPSHELVSEGMEAFEDRDYRRAIAAFEKLKDWYPFSKYAILAELKIADSHYHLGEYEEAVAAYEEFESLHPRNEAVPYVIFQMGNCYFEQMDSIDRDQGVVRKALETYNRLLKQYPDDPYAAKAQQNIRECQKSLAGHEFYVGLFYYKNKQYEPAVKRFRTVLSDYPDVGIHQKALHYIALCEKFLQKDREKQRPASSR
ncbi:MAG: outer membrane protein assembly factor BamD [Desulfobacterales bacterium]